MPPMHQGVIVGVIMVVSVIAREMHVQRTEWRRQQTDAGK